MFSEIIEYEKILEKIVNDTDLTENQINKFISIIVDYPTLSPQQLLDLSISINNDEKIIMDGYTEYAFNPILNESKKITLLELVLPIIRENIPDTILIHMNETSLVMLLNEILNLPINLNDNQSTITTKINEMFSSGNLSIPIQGLRKQPTTIEIVTNGVFAPMLFKGIQFDKKFHKLNNKSRTIRDLLQSVEPSSLTPLQQILPKILITLKQLLKTQG